MLYKDRDCMTDTEGWREITLDFGASDTQSFLTSAPASVDHTASISQPSESETLGKEMSLGKAWGLAINSVTQEQWAELSPDERDQLASDGIVAHKAAGGQVSSDFRNHIFRYVRFGSFDEGDLESELFDEVCYEVAANPFTDSEYEFTDNGNSFPESLYSASMYTCYDNTLPEWVYSGSECTDEDNAFPERLYLEYEYTADSGYGFTNDFNAENLRSAYEFKDDDDADSETPLLAGTSCRSASSKAKETWDTEHYPSWFPFDSLTRREREIYDQMAEMMWRLKQEAKSLPSAALPPHLFNTWRYFDGAMFGISSKSIDVHDRLFMAGEGQCMVCKQSRREPRLDEVPVGTPADTHPGWTERIPEWTQSAAEMSWIDFD